MKILEYIEKTAGIRGLNLAPKAKSVATRERTIEDVIKSLDAEIMPLDPVIAENALSVLGSAPNRTLQRALNRNFKADQQYMLARAQLPSGTQLDIQDLSSIPSPQERAHSRLSGGGSHGGPHMQSFMTRALNDHSQELEDLAGLLAGKYGRS